PSKRSRLARTRARRRPSSFPSPRDRARLPRSCAERRSRRRSTRSPPDATDAGSSRRCSSTSTSGHRPLVDKVVPFARPEVGEKEATRPEPSRNAAEESLVPSSRGVGHGKERGNPVEGLAREVDLAEVRLDEARL